MLLFFREEALKRLAARSQLPQGVEFSSLWALLRELNRNFSQEVVHMSDYEILVIMLTILEIVVMLLIALINAKK